LRKPAIGSKSLWGSLAAGASSAETLVASARALSARNVSQA
jgi:hypothetical protein